jgi:hypothetical protein
MILEKTLYNLRETKHSFFNIKKGDFVDFETLKLNIRFTDFYNNKYNKNFIFKKTEIFLDIYTTFFKFYKGGEIFYLSKDGRDITYAGTNKIYFI